jgi:hypothetical protein
LLVVSPRLGGDNVRVIALLEEFDLVWCFEHIDFVSPLSEFTLFNVLVHSEDDGVLDNCGN